MLTCPLQHQGWPGTRQQSGSPGSVQQPGSSGPQGGTGPVEHPSSGQGASSLLSAPTEVWLVGGGAVPVEVPVPPTRKSSVRQPSSATTSTPSATTPSPGLGRWRRWGRRPLLTTQGVLGLAMVGARREVVEVALPTLHPLVTRLAATQARTRVVGKAAVGELAQVLPP